MARIYTIGHSNHAIDAFVGLLRTHAVDAVADVRSHPYSRFNPQFRRDALRAALGDAGIEYVFLGRELGGRCEDPACYAGRKVQYSLRARTAEFRSGLDRIAEHAARQRLALMCAEQDPLMCHRAILVCRELIAGGPHGRGMSGVHSRDITGTADDNAARGVLTVQHILADGRLESQKEADARLLEESGIDAPDLFRGRDEAIAEAYRRRADEIAWVAPE